MALTKVHNRMVSGAVFNVLDYGAIPDYDFDTSTGTDNTASIQAAIDAASALDKAVVHFPSGAYLVDGLTITSGVTLTGESSPGQSYIVQSSGQTDPLLTDDGNCYNIWIRDLVFDGNNNTPSTALIYLGETSQQFGVLSGMSNVFARNADGVGMWVNGNVSYFDQIEVYFCTIGFVLRGNANMVKNVTFSNIDNIGLDIRGTGNIVDNVYGEGDITTALVNVIDNAPETSISNVKASIINSTMGSIVKLGLNCFVTSVSNVMVGFGGTGSTTNGLIYDTSAGTRKIFGVDYSSLYKIVDNYLSGSRARLPYNSNQPPTTGTHLQGDWFVAGSGGGGSPFGWACVAGGSPGTFAPMTTQPGTIVKTADETLTTGDNGKRFSNEGATGVVTLTLPTAFVGARFHFTRRNSSHALRIDPAASYLWPSSVVGKYAQIDTDGGSITIEYISANQYTITAQSGSLSFEP